MPERFVQLVRDGRDLGFLSISCTPARLKVKLQRFQETARAPTVGRFIAYLRKAKIAVKRIKAKEVAF